MISAVKRIEFLSDGMSYIVLRGRWCNIVLNVRAPNEEKSENSKHCIIEELQQIFSHFHLCLRNVW
jgi:hypothetical protein